MSGKNAITESLRNRKSVRAFEDRQIAENIKQEILRCAAQAPTAGNQQLYTILDITDQALKGIFLYMGNEEIALRRNPGKLLKGIF